MSTIQQMVEAFHEGDVRASSSLPRRTLRARSGGMATRRVQRAPLGSMVTAVKGTYAARRSAQALIRIWGMPFTHAQVSPAKYLTKNFASLRTVAQGP